MLSLGKLTWPQWNSVFLPEPISKTFIFPAKTHQTRVSFSPNRLVHLDLFGVVGHLRTGFCIYASKSQKQGGNSLLEIGNFDEDGDFFEEEEEEGFDEDDDEDEEVIPLNSMKKWLQNKPRGFGEGKVYDTSIEDNLMEELEQSRQAQLANINNLKNNPVKSTSKKEQSQLEKVSEDCKHGFRVRLVNLPKKKNIHRDLQSVFKGVPGIINIVPVVSGNKRTKDPICKGLAYIDFKSEHEAYRFIETFSGQSITFGKVQKQIKCDMSSSVLKPGTEHVDTSYSAQPAVASSDYQAEKVYIKFESENEVHNSVELLDNEEGLGDNQSLPLPESLCENGQEEREESIVQSSSLKEKRGVQGKGKNIASKTKKEKIPKINTLGSANRLKTREKAMLAGVFSKYATKTSMMTESRAD